MAKDFHTINIYVPPEQIIDTVDIYYYPYGRKKGDEVVAIADSR